MRGTYSSARGGCFRRMRHEGVISASNELPRSTCTLTRFSLGHIVFQGTRTRIGSRCASSCALQRLILMQLRVGGQLRQKFGAKSLRGSADRCPHAVERNGANGLGDKAGTPFSSAWSRDRQIPLSPRALEGAIVIAFPRASYSYILIRGLMSFISVSCARPRRLTLQKALVGGFFGAACW